MPVTEAVIVFPALNEGDRLMHTLREYRDHFGDRVRLLVVDNGSQDGTIDKLNANFVQGREVEWLGFPRPLGKGGAVYAGFDHVLQQPDDANARTAVLGFTDPDGSTTPAEFEKLMQALSEVDLAVASRWVSGGRMLRRQPWRRVIAGRVFNQLVNLLFGLEMRDTQCGAKALYREVYQKLQKQLTLRGYAFDVELLARAKNSGYTIKEVPIEWQDRPGSRFSLGRSGLRAVRDVIQLRLRM